MAIAAALTTSPVTTASSAAPQKTVSSAGDSSRLAQDASRSWIDKHPGKVKEARGDAFVRTGTLTGADDTRAVAYERTHQGLPVVGGDFVVVTDATGDVLATSVAQDRPVDLASTTPTRRGRDRAVEAARGRVAEVSDVSEPRLVVWQRGRTALAWETQVRGTHRGWRAVVAVRVRRRGRRRGPRAPASRSPTARAPRRTPAPTRSRSRPAARAAPTR